MALIGLLIIGLSYRIETGLKLMIWPTALPTHVKQHFFAKEGDIVSKLHILLKWQLEVPVGMGSRRASVARKLHALIHVVRPVVPTWNAAVLLP